MSHIDAGANSDGPFAPELGLLAEVAPQAYATLVDAWSAAHEALSPSLLALLRHRVEVQFGLAPDRDSDQADGPDRWIADLADQFVFYVPGISEELRAPVREHFGSDGLRTLLEALYVLDQTARLRLTHARLFQHGGSPQAPHPATPGLAVRDAIAELHGTIIVLDDLDPLTTEMVRLRAGNYHECKT